MIFSIRKYVVHNNVYFLKRSFFYSVILNANNQESVTSQFNDETKLHEKNKKLLNVAILGLPNAGKSTLINKLIHRSVCPTSSKVHTTLHKAKAIYTEGDTQIVFIDTPGLVNSHEIKKYELSKTFKKDPETAVNEADIIGIIQDVTNIYTRHKIDNFILDYINNKREDTQLLMIFNKVDKLKKKESLLNLTRMIINNKNYPKFNDIFMVSALTGDGVNDLRNYLLDSSKIKDWKYEEEYYTDQQIETITEQTVRAKLLDILPHDMPYKVKIEIEHFTIGDDGTINAYVTLNCPKQRFVKSLLKAKAAKIKCLSYYVEKELRHAFRTTVIVRINVCTKTNSIKL
ncbi:PREDICTED: GTPase Era, mitochondrial [Eufriesea mexicana]|uniref:GTPase Era, mitochondrial n=1 Tax=Eufriesea mexicana TaxID=516756 RepID=UPI00083C9061|nr:PREDICTED: GTPase Era, mitochondrial [Eufriesea mexicana]